MSKEVSCFKFVNERQNLFYDTVMSAVIGENQYRHFYYGGAVRGGKTFVCLYIFVVMARLFPKSRWHVIREDFPALEKTAIPSMEKLLGTQTKSKDFVWKKNKGNYHVLFSNGSRIFFIAENFQRDNDLKEFLGLETNGILLEQMEALNKKMLARAIERLGSWYIPLMPIPLLLGTTNPTKEWPKEHVYERALSNTLKDNEIYVEALPEDNPFVTDEQWANWDNMDEDSYRQMIKGDWSFPTDGRLFAYKFERKRHVIDCTTEEGKKFFEVNRNFPVDLIFDFNVDPITCLVGQHNKTSWGKIIKEYRLRNSDIFPLLEQVKEDFGEYFLTATGDASGRARQAAVKGNKSFVRIIQQELQLTDKQIQFPLTNPSVSDTRILMNSIFNKHGNFHIASRCVWLINDLETVKTDEKGAIEKKKDKLKTHLLDNLRYFQWNYFKNFLIWKS